MIAVVVLAAILIGSAFRLRHDVSAERWVGAPGICYQRHSPPDLRGPRCHPWARQASIATSA
jgi:hypothetical protein